MIIKSRMNDVKIGNRVIDQYEREQRHTNSSVYLFIVRHNEFFVSIHYRHRYSGYARNSMFSTYLVFSLCSYSVLGIFGHLLFNWYNTV